MTFIPGNVQLSKIEMRNITGDRSADITAQVIRIDVFESILVPTIEVELLIADGIGLRTRFPIIGEETISFTFQTETGLKRELTMNVVQLENVEAEVNSQLQAYVLKLVSPEVLESEKKLITKRINDTSASVIKTILTNHIGTKKKFYYDQTDGIDNLIIDNLKAFQAIDFARRRSISNKYKSSSFCFFENRDGYQLYTLEGMFDRGKDQVGDKIFFYDNNVNHDVRTVNYRNILGYEHVSVADSPQQINRTRVTSLDIVTGDITTEIYGDEDYKSVDGSSRNIYTGSFNQMYRSDVSNEALVPIDSSLPEYRLPQKLGQSVSFSSKIISNILNLWVYGDSSISAGDVIEVRLPRFEGTTTAPEQDRLISGNYLISKCRHMLVFDGGQVVYTQSFELLKGTYLGNV